MSRVTEPVPEAVVRLSVNGTGLLTWTASPRDLDALGAGRLLSLGYIRDRSHLLDLRVRPPRAGEAAYQIVAEIPPVRLAAGLEEREHRSHHGCGLHYLMDCRPDQLPARDGTAPVPDLGVFPAVFRELYDRSPSRGSTGGHHTTALSDGDGLLHLHEVVGRHNGADKAIGGALLAGHDLAGLGLVTTARISGQIAEKAARAGVAWIASRSVPTTLAVEIAAAAGLPIIARAAGQESRIFWPGTPTPPEGRSPR